LPSAGCPFVSAVDSLCRHRQAPDIQELHVETTVNDYPSVADRVAALGCQMPSGLAILPDNFVTASSPDDFVYADTATTIRTLLRNHSIPCEGVVSSGERPKYSSHKNAEWVGPVSYISWSLLTDSGAQWLAALEVMKDYLTEYFRGRPAPTTIKLRYIVETTPGHTYKMLDYEGNIEGMDKLPAVLRAVADD
jgi:hypothetical protein